MSCSKINCSCCTTAYVAGFCDGFKKGFQCGYDQGYVDGYVDRALGRPPKPRYLEPIRERLVFHTPRITPLPAPPSVLSFRPKPLLTTLACGCYGTCTCIRTFDPITNTSTLKCACYLTCTCRTVAPLPTYEPPRLNPVNTLWCSKCDRIKSACTCATTLLPFNRDW